MIQHPEKAAIPDGTRTHSLRLRKPTPCPFGHWDRYAWSGVRTHADWRPADLKSAPLDLSGIQAYFKVPFTSIGPLSRNPASKFAKTRSYRDLNPDRRIQSPEWWPLHYRTTYPVHSNMTYSRRWKKKPGDGKKQKWYILDLCVSSLRRGHANLLCIVPIFADDLREVPSKRTLLG